jgi:hypothetical protein
MLIQPVEVKRDENGYWSHPGIPDFDEDYAAYKAWLTDQRLEICFENLEGEDDSHPAYQNYFENENPNISSWNPSWPDGEGWFVLSIHDTEDGPYYVWARRKNIDAHGQGAER